MDENEDAAANLAADYTAWLSAADPANFILDDPPLPDEQLHGSADQSSVEALIAEVMAEVRASSDASTCRNTPHAPSDDAPESVDQSTGPKPWEQPAASSTDATAHLPGSESGTAHDAASAVTSTDAAAAGTGGDAPGYADSVQPSASKLANSDSDSGSDWDDETLSAFLANPEGYFPADLTEAQYAAWCMIWQPGDLRFLRDYPSSRKGRRAMYKRDPIDPVNLRDPGTGATPLIAAARAGCVDTIAALMRRGANPEARDNTSCTAADWARNSGRADVVAALAVAPGVPIAQQNAEQYMLKCNTPDGPQDANLIYELLCQICGESSGATWGTPEVCTSRSSLQVGGLSCLVTHAMAGRCALLGRSLYALGARQHLQGTQEDDSFG